MGESENRPSNEYVLNVAFFSFIGFVCFQTVFAIVGNSQAMLADSEAMAVDSMTYLFNLWAERVKKSPIKNVPNPEYRRELRRLYLELLPPLVSLSTMVVITFNTSKEAFDTLDKGEDEDVSVLIMLFFSTANLLIDIVNVTCFARAKSLFLSITPATQSIEPSETTSLIASGAPLEDQETIRVPHTFHNHNLVNLNMCSAWTHICADTMRSTAVLIAAAIAFLSPQLSGTVADSVAALVVSGIILVSLIPLLYGLLLTAFQIYRLYHDDRIHSRPSTSIV